MKSLIFRSALLFTAFAVAIGFSQDTNQFFQPKAPTDKLFQPKEPIRLSVPPQSEFKFRIVDPIAKHVQATTKAAAAQGERQLAVPRAQEWNAPTNPASLPHPALPQAAIAVPRPSSRPAVIQADMRLQTQRRLVPQIRLVQAEDVDDSFLDDLRTSSEDSGNAPVGGDDIDELLKQAQDLIKEERDKATDDRMTPEQIRSRMQDELDRLLPDEEDEENDLLAGGDDPDDEEDFSDLVDPQPKPVRRQQRNLPYTMGDIFDDESETDPVCEQMFCERMWACAGGKCMSSMDRMKRSFRRNYAVFYSPCGTPVCRPMENFKCPPRNRQPQNQNQFANQAMVGPHQNAPIMEQPPLVESFPGGEYPVETLPIESPVEFSTSDIPTEAAMPSILGDAAATGTIGPMADEAGTIFGPAQ